MKKTLIFGFILALVLHFLGESRCAPLVSGIERESKGKQLEFPNENEIPGDVIPREERPRSPSGPRGIPGFPRRQSEGILNRIVNFFKEILGVGSPTVGPDGRVGPGGDPNERGVIAFIRRTFSGLINQVLKIFNGNGVGGQNPLNPDAAEFPYQRPRFEPLRRN